MRQRPFQGDNLPFSVAEETFGVMGMGYKFHVGLI